ncbi:hypothetical protein [Levilactobacillus suantsaii]|uniref:Chemotaxis protein n=1 Tax=Levilactobacillus suantsaii TaxID=2292255 RepID=A0A4Q0VIJ0_9LACO|nr:hypothetical protein [Levilactobacillus suantsaii]QMU07049.1 hypothetical protein H3M12_05915 [Levilactobacillus suantsaii]RXI76521.1 hypothetical protein DXH47_10565 [Levilactobacillus suantsaii]
MRKVNMSTYIGTLSQVLQGTEDEADQMNTDFETVRKALDNGTVAELTVADLTDIKTHFQAGTTAYQGKLDQLQNASVPVRILGKHKALVAAYRTYVAGCQSMTDSLDADQQTVDQAAFDAAEKTQENAMTKVTAATQRIMTSVQ